MRWFALLLLVVAVVFFSLAQDPRERATKEPPGVSASPPQAPAGKQDPRFVAAADDPDATLRVVVTDSAGRPCVGAMVRPGVVVDGVGMSGPEAATDSEGRVALEVEADRTRSVTARVGCLSRWVQVRLTKGESRAIGIVMPTGGRIVGSIRHPRSGPLRGVALTTRLTEGYFLRAETDARGRFAFDPVPRGAYKISIYARQCRHNLKDYVVVRHDGTETIDLGTILVGEPRWRARCGAPPTLARCSASVSGWSILFERRPRRMRPVGMRSGI